MNKKVFGKKLSRGRSAREALFSSLISSLIINGKIVTTKTKAKAIKGVVQSYIHLAKKGTLDIRRRVLSELKNDNRAVKMLFDKKFISVRNINLPARKGDNAPRVRLELNENLPTKEKRDK